MKKENDPRREDSINQVQSLNLLSLWAQRQGEEAEWSATPTIAW